MLHHPLIIIRAALDDPAMRIGALRTAGSQNVVEIDMTTFQAVATYDTPDVTVEWIGLAIAPSSVGGGNSIFLIGSDHATGDGVLKELKP